MHYRLLLLYDIIYMFLCVSSSPPESPALKGRDGTDPCSGEGKTVTAGSWIGGITTKPTRGAYHNAPDEPRASKHRKPG